MEPPRILHERALPRDSQREEERIEPSVVESFADVSPDCKKEAFLVRRNGVELRAYRAVRVPAHASLEHDQVPGHAREAVRKILEVIPALRQEDRRASFLERTHDVVHDDRVARFVACKCGIELLADIEAI
jgi:hypothetical protein